MSLLQSVLWLLLGRWFYNIISLISFPIIVSQLTISDYGVYAVTSTLLIFADTFFADGVENTIVRQSGDRRVVATCGMFVSVGYACLLSSIYWVMGDLITAFYQDPLYGETVTVIAGLVMIQGLAVIPRALLLKSERPRRLALCLSLGNLVGAGMGITAAFSGLGVWSLLLQQASLHLVVLVVGFWIVGFRPILRIDWAIVRSMTRFTWFSFWSTVLNIASNRLDIIVLSINYNEQISGLYALAKRVIQILQDLVASSFDKIFISIHSRSVALGNVSQTHSLYRQSVLAQAILVFPSFAGIALVAHSLIPEVFGSAWQDAAPLIAFMAAGGIFRSLVTIERADQFAGGYVGRILLVRLIELVISVALILPAARWGPAAVAAAFSLRYLLSYLLVLSSYGTLPPQLLRKLGQILKLQLPVMLATTVMIATVLATRRMLDLQGLTEVMSEISLGVTVYVLVLLLLKEAWLDIALGRGAK